MKIRVSIAVVPGRAPATAADRTAWMREARWGVMTHYLADWQATALGLKMSVAQWNALVDGFDVEALGDQLLSVGAPYYQITLGQNSGYYLSPNTRYDRLVGIQPSKCSRRDLIADLGTALEKRGIRLMVYLPSGAPAADKAATVALEWRNGPYPNKEFQKKWEQVIREWSLRWGRTDRTRAKGVSPKGSGGERSKVSGWWFDGCYFPNSMYRSRQAPNFASFAAAARAGNPHAAVAFNPGVVYRLLPLTPHEDFTAGEIDKPELVTVRRAVDGKIDGVQIQVLSYLGQSWGMGEPRFTPEQVVSHTQRLRSLGAVVTWDVPANRNGTIPQAFLDQLTAIRDAVR